MNSIDRDIEIVVEKMRSMAAVTTPYYIADHMFNVNKILSNMEKDPVKKLQKYPLIILVTDPQGNVDGDVTDYKLNLIIVDRTQINYTKEQRYTNVITPILEPLYESFFTALRRVGIFMWPGQQDKPKHVKTVRPFYGNDVLGKNEAYLIPDPVDAIQITNLEINRRYKDC